VRKIVSAMALLFAFASSAEASTPTPHRSLRAGRPAAWCGWYMRSQVGGDPGPEYNLASAWAHYGANAGGPSVGTSSSGGTTSARLLATKMVIG
jgi:hypothetical protein